MGLRLDRYIFISYPRALRLFLVLFYDVQSPSTELHMWLKVFLNWSTLNDVYPPPQLLLMVFPLFTFHSPCQSVWISSTPPPTSHSLPLYTIPKYHVSLLYSCIPSLLLSFSKGIIFLIPKPLVVLSVSKQALHSICIYATLITIILHTQRQALDHQWLKECMS